MDDFFGDPLFQPTGVDWIDHTFTAAILDDTEREERARQAFDRAFSPADDMIDDDEF